MGQPRRREFTFRARNKMLQRQNSEAHRLSFQNAVLIGFRSITDLCAWEFFEPLDLPVTS